MEEQIVNNRAAEILLDVADLIEKDDSLHEERIKSLLWKLTGKPLFKEYGLDENDVRVIAILFGRFFEDEDGMTIRNILKKLGGGKKTAFNGIDRINNLERLNILEIEGLRARLASIMTNNPSAAIAAEADPTEDSLAILRSTASLTEYFLHRICDSGKKAKKEKSEPYRDNLEYLADQFTKIRLSMNDYELGFLINPENPRRFRKNRKGSENWHDDTEDKIKKLEDMITERLAKTDKVFPFEEFKKHKKLTREEELIVSALLEGEVLGNRSRCHISYLLEVISKTSYEKMLNRKLFEKDGRLMKEKIIEIESGSGMFNEEDAMRLNGKIKSRLLGEKRKKVKLTDGGLFEVIKPSVSLDKVILHPKTHDEISLAVEMVQGGVACRLREWGITGSNLLQTHVGKKRQPITMLYYGAPGTGKTLTANAVAYRLKRDLITFDCSKILSCWVGEAEKNTRMIFDRYREVSEGMNRPPVLLLNEADQFLHRRISARGSADHSYNQMQNIFLEQIERFDGVLIATTNLAENMDTAFSRRFHYKIEFKRPGPGERIRLWRVHMPEKAPLSEDIELEYLSNRYDLSGGQIAIVVRNAATRAARRGDRLCQEDLIRACEEEIAGNFDEKGKARLGFKL